MLVRYLLRRTRRRKEWEEKYINNNVERKQRGNELGRKVGGRQNAGYKVDFREDRTKRTRKEGIGRNVENEIDRRNAKEKGKLRKQRKRESMGGLRKTREETERETRL